MLQNLQHGRFLFIIMLKKTMLLLVALPAFFLSCTKSSSDSATTTDCTTPKTFAADANPVIQATCATSSGCHGAGSFAGPGTLQTYTQVYNNRSAIRRSVANGSMPQGSNLTAAQKNAILCWIDSGAPNN